MPSHQFRHILDGLQVLDFSQFIAGQQRRGCWQRWALRLSKSNRARWRPHEGASFHS